MSVTANLCCDETKNRGTYTRVTFLGLLIRPRVVNRVLTRATVKGLTVDRTEICYR